MTNRTRWATDTGPEHSQWYVNRFRQLAAEGADLAGEARLLDTLVPPASRILDAGCGTAGSALNSPRAPHGGRGGPRTRS